MIDSRILRTIRHGKPKFKVLGEFFNVGEVVADRYSTGKTLHETLGEAANKSEQEVISNFKLVDNSKKEIYFVKYRQLINGIRVSPRGSGLYVNFNMVASNCSIVRKAPRGIVLQDLNVSVDRFTEFEIKNLFNPYADEACSVALKTPSGNGLAIGVRVVKNIPGEGTVYGVFVTVIDPVGGVIYVDNFAKYHREDCAIILER